MKQDLFDLASTALKSARAAGADAASVRVSTDRSVEIAYRERRPETIKEASTKGIELNLYAGGRYSSQSSSDLRPEALNRFIAQAVAATRLLAPDPHRTLPDPKYYQGRADLDLRRLDPGYAAFTPEERHRIVRDIEAACLAEGGEKVVSVSAGCGDGIGESVMLASNGFEGHRTGTEFGMQAEITLRDAGDRLPNEYSYATAVRRDALPSAESIGREAARRALASLGARKIKTATLPIIVENRCAGRLLGGLVGGMSGRNLQQRQSFLIGRLGERIGSPRLTLVDDPFIVGSLGGRLFDGDGLAARRRTMIEGGVLKEYFVNWYYSRKLGCEPTTGGPSNLVLQPGARPVAAIMKDLGRGILVTGFIGGNSNATTGDTSVGITGTYFEGGAPVHAVAEMNIAGNHLKFWHNLAEVADDPWTYGTWRLPSLVFTDIAVSGA